MTSLTGDEVSPFLCHVSTSFRIGSKFRRIRSMPTEIQSLSENYVAGTPADSVIKTYRHWYKGMMRLNPSRAVPVFFLFLLVPLASAEVPFRISVDSSRAPQCETFTRNAKVLVEEWYPKINEILFSPDHPLATNSITIICEPLKAIAYTDIKKNIIHLSAAYVDEKAPDDYGMVIHQLTHIVQHYNKLKPSEVWLQEGIADYIRHRYFDGDLDRLTIDSHQSSYRQGHKPAALFLAWLQGKKDPNLVHNLNEACSQGHCGPDLFVRFCGMDIETLWSQFASELPMNAIGKK